MIHNGSGGSGGGMGVVSTWEDDVNVGALVEPVGSALEGMEEVEREVRDFDDAKIGVRFPVGVDGVDNGSDFLGRGWDGL